MRLPQFLRSSTFRLAASFAVIFAGSTALLFAFIYWQTALFETARVEQFIVDDVHVLASYPIDTIKQTVTERVVGDLHRITFAGLFDPDGHVIAGNLDKFPPELAVDGAAHPVRASRHFDDIASSEPMLAVAQRLGNGDVIVIGRTVDELVRLKRVVLRALELGVGPASLLAVVAGAFVSWRTESRVKAVHNAAERIMSGDLRERLPTRGTRDDFDRLAQSVNRMLDEIGRLLDSVKGAGDDIAHDLRTPLARLRTRLERARISASTQDELETIVETAIRDLDQALTVIGTILRVGEIDAGRRRSSFQPLDLSALVEEAAQIYGPLAEEKGLAFESHVEPMLQITGDQGLLMEAVANLIQNAIKFTQTGGRIRVEALRDGDKAAVRIIDNGPGIPEEARSRIFDRFYRLDQSRSIEGSGLGLSLVAAIAKLHRFQVGVRDAEPGSVFEIRCG